MLVAGEEVVAAVGVAVQLPVLHMQLLSPQVTATQLQVVLLSLLQQHQERLAFSSSSQVVQGLNKLLLVQVWGAQQQQRQLVNTSSLQPTSIITSSSSSSP